MANTAIPGAWKTVALLCVVGCLNYLDRIMVTTMRVSLIEAIPMTEAQFGLLTSVFLWVYGLLSPLAGFLADRFNRSRVIIGSLFLWSLVTWFTAQATTFNELLFTHALMGISEACYLPAALALIMDYHRGNTRSMATAIHTGGVMIGQSLGFLGGWIAEHSKWNNAFNIFGLIGILYSVLLAFTLRDVPEMNVPVEEKAGTEKSSIRFVDAVRDLFSRKAFFFLLLFWGLLGIVGWLIFGWLPTYYREHFHLSQSVSGLYATGYLYPISFFGSLAGGFLADYFSRKYETARIIIPAIALMIAAPVVFIAANTDVVYVAIAGFMVYIFMRIFSDANMMPILCMIADKRYRATGYGILNMFACIVGGVSVYASGMLRDANIRMDNLFKSAALLLLIGAFLLLLIQRQVKRQPKIM